MWRIAQGKERFLLLAGLCLSLAVPVEIHGTIVEVGTHEVEGAVSVDARHADQEAHLEHSAVEMRSHCAACVLTPESRVLPCGLQHRPQPMPQIGALSARKNLALRDLSSTLSPSRAPPLL